MSTQDATEGLQNNKKKGSKNGPNLYQFLDHLRDHFGVHSGARIDSKVGPKMGQVFLTHRRDPPSCTRWPRAAPLALPKVGSACLGLYDKNGKPVLQSKTHSVSAKMPEDAPRWPKGGPRLPKRFHIDSRWTAFGSFFRF